MATRITKRELKNIEELNELAKKNSTEFVAKLLSESAKQKAIDDERQKKLEDLFGKLEDQRKALERTKKRADNVITRFDDEVKQRENTIEKLAIELERQKKLRLSDENERRRLRRELYVNQSVKKWRRKSWIEVTSLIVIFFSLMAWMLYISSWSFVALFDLILAIKSSIVILALGAVVNSLFFGHVVTSLRDKYRNHSNIKAYKESILIPEELRDLNDLVGATDSPNSPHL